MAEHLYIELERTNTKRNLKDEGGREGTKSVPVGLILILIVNM